MKFQGIKIIRGVGFNVIFITLACVLSFYFFIGKSTFILNTALVFSGMVIWFYARYQKIRDLSKSGVSNIHALLGIKIKYWSILIAGIGLIRIIVWLSGRWSFENLIQNLVNIY